MVLNVSIYVPPHLNSMMMHYVFPKSGDIFFLCSLKVELYQEQIWMDIPFSWAILANIQFQLVLKPPMLLFFHLGITCHLQLCQYTLVSIWTQNRTTLQLQLNWQQSHKNPKTNVYTNEPDTSKCFSMQW